MPPIWLCPDCEGVAYGWAGGPCIHCGSHRVVGTEPISPSQPERTDYRLLFFTEKQWAQIEAQAILAGCTPRALVAEREQEQIVLVRDEPVGHGQLILLKLDESKTKVRSPD